MQDFAHASEFVHVAWYVSTVDLDASLKRFEDEMKKGVRHFFVALPRGFRHVPDDDECKDEHNTPPHERNADGTVVRRRLSFVEVRQSDLELLAARSSVAISEFGHLALFGIVGEDPENLRHLCLRRVPRGRIEPGSRTIASRTANSSFMTGICPTVLREPAETPSGFSYRLHGVTIMDLVVVDKTPPPSSESSNSSDEFGISEACPTIVAILREAHRYSHTTSGKQVDHQRIELTLQELEQSGRLGNIGRFSDRRLELISKLADPHFIRKAKKKVAVLELQCPLKLEFDASAFPTYVNPSLARAIYAARCWTGQSAPKVDGNKELLRDLLVQLGFNDASSDDEVQCLMYFITGEKPNRKDLPFFHVAEVRS